ncbi:MAG: hypothetical protein V7K50_09705 [Nostoc sp.]|uniref:hypothetical protein n=1 Tax=Nostoc sp. TaxID=1180 RepID=UPI002FFC7FD9
MKATNLFILGIGNWALGTCTEFRHFGYAQCIATLNYREAVGAASPRVVLGMVQYSSPSSPHSPILYSSDDAVDLRK